MNDEEKARAYEHLREFLSDCFEIEMNMNDVFGWACAESEMMDCSDIDQMLPLYAKYGSTAMVAYASVKRGGQLPQEPLLKRYGDTWPQALAEVQRLAANGDILYDQWLQRQREAAK